MVMHALRSEKDSVEFYKSQGDAYDGFREALLPDRDQLQHYCLPWQTKLQVMRTKLWPRQCLCVNLKVVNLLWLFDCCSQP
jgi:hypothetical protein